MFDRQNCWIRFADYASSLAGTPIEGWEECQIVITYGWLNQKSEAPRLIPLTILSWCRDKKHVYWCRGQFTDYRMFSVRTKIVAPDSAQAALSH